jgi:hypothetical protein
MPWSFTTFSTVQSKRKEQEASESHRLSKHRFLVTFRLSTERNVKRLVVAAAAQVQLLLKSPRVSLALRARATVWPCGAELPQRQWKVSFIWL